jgi:hypothetical protein
LRCTVERKKERKKKGKYGKYHLNNPPHQLASIQIRKMAVIIIQ